MRPLTGLSNCPSPLHLGTQGPGGFHGPILLLPYKQGWADWVTQRSCQVCVCTLPFTGLGRQTPLRRCQGIISG